MGEEFFEVGLHRVEARAEHEGALRGRFLVVAEEAGLLVVFGALQFLELLFARERRVVLRGETLAFELVAITRGGFGYGVVFGEAEEGSFAGAVGRALATTWSEARPSSVVSAIGRRILRRYSCDLLLESVSGAGVM
jgi:hypothetical protein